MAGAIVTVTLRGSGLALDLEVPPEMPAAELGPLLLQAFGPTAEPASVRLTIHPPGRTLAPQESLADAGVWDGGWLVLETG